jgi:hypothetical protein
MTVKETIDWMRNALTPKGTEPVVRIFLEKNTYMDENFIKQAIKEFETKLILESGLNEPPSALEKIGMMVLSDSAYLCDRMKYED